MNVYILDPNNNLKYVIDYAESIIFNHKFNDIGDCEIYMPYIDNDVLDKIDLNDIIIKSFDEINLSFIIKSIEIESTFEKGNYITIKGETFNTLLTQRVIVFAEEFSQTIYQNCQQIAESINGGPYFNNEIYVTNRTGDSVNRNFVFEFTTIFDAIKDMCAVKNLCFTFENSNEGLYYLNLFKNYTTNIVFSPQNNNLISFKKENNNYNNVTFTYTRFETGDAEDPEATLSGGDVYEGNDAFHVNVDATDVKREDYTDSAFFNIIENKENAVIYEGRIKDNIDIEIDASMYRFPFDYNIGAIVKIIDFFGNEYNAKVYEVTEKWDANGYACEPKLEIIKNT